MDSSTIAVAAPILRVPAREIVAVEHPMIVKNIDNGLKTFGAATALSQVRIPSFEVLPSTFLFGKLHV